MCNRSTLSNTHYLPSGYLSPDRNTTDPPPPAPGPRLTTTTSISSRVTLPSVPALIRAIFQTDPSPIPVSALPSLSATRHLPSATPMAPPCTTARPGSSERYPPPHPTTSHLKTGRTLCRLGSYRMKHLEELTSRSR